MAIIDITVNYSEERENWAARWKSRGLTAYGVDQEAALNRLCEQVEYEADSIVKWIKDNPDRILVH